MKRTLLLHPERVEKAVVINKEHPYADRGYISLEEEIDWYITFLQIPWLPGYIGRLGNWGLLVANLRATSLPGTFSDQGRYAVARVGTVHVSSCAHRSRRR